MYFQMWMTRVMFQLHSGQEYIGDVIRAYRLRTEFTDLTAAALGHGWNLTAKKHKIILLKITFKR